MTLILTCLTKDFVVQASDRRLTATIDNRVEVIEDQSNKALVYSNHFAFAYTGLAKLPDISAIDWAAQQLSEKANLGDAVLHLGNRASDLMNSDPIRNYYSRFPARVKRLAFVGAGFAQREINGKQHLVPLRIVVSNFFRSKDEAWVALPYRIFSVFYNWFPERQRFKLFVAGIHLSKERMDGLNNRIKWCLRHKEGPEMIGRLLSGEIQEVADESDFVGKNIMCTFVPRALGTGTRVHWGGLFFNPPVVSTEPQRLEPIEVKSVHDHFVFPPPFDAPRFEYFAGDNKALPYHIPAYAGPGYVLPSGCIEEMSITVTPATQMPNQQAEIIP